MPSLAATHERHEPTRSLTWPSTIRTAEAQQHKAEPASLSSPALVSRQSQPTSFEDELNQHPEAHYLSPVQMHEYQPWDDSDDDDDGEEVEWNAGITDFALFDSDRRAAEERKEAVPGRWNDLIASQASALQRSNQRMRSASDSSSPQPIAPLLEDLPQLTPDNSPQMRDDFDMDTFCAERGLRSIVPSISITPPSDEVHKVFSYAEADDDDSPSSSDSDEDEDDELPVTLLIERAKLRREQARKLERPGLLYSRTLSGKVHVWRRPSSDIYTLRENADAEEAAEKADNQTA